MAINERMTLRERKKLDTRARILQSANRLFLQFGYERLTVEDIAIAADVGKGTIYNYFSSKEAVLAAFMVELEKRVQGRVSEILKQNLPPALLLEKYCWEQLQVKGEYRPLVRAYFGYLAMEAKLDTPWVQQMQSVVDPPLERLLGRMQHRGEIDLGWKLSAVVSAYRMMQNSVMQVWLMDEDPFQATQDLLRQQIHFLLAGYQRPPSGKA